MTQVAQITQVFKKEMLEAVLTGGSVTTTVYHGLATGLTGSPANSFTVSDAANNGAGLVRVTTSAPHSYITGDIVVISGVLGTVEANGVWTVTKYDGSNFDLQGSSFANTHSAGGTQLCALAKTLILSNLVDITSSGYSRQAVASNGWTSQLTGTDWQMVGLGTATFTNNSGSTWQTATFGFMCTAASGTSGVLQAIFQLASPRTLLGGGDTETIVPTLNLAG